MSVGPLLGFAYCSPRQGRGGHLNSSFLGEPTLCRSWGDRAPPPTWKPACHSASLHTWLDRCDAPARDWDSHVSGIVMQGQVRNHQELGVCMVVVLTCLLILLSSLLWFLSIFIGWSSCLLVSSVGHQTSFQCIPFLSCKSWLLPPERRSFWYRAETPFTTGMPVLDWRKIWADLGVQRYSFLGRSNR